tara:strand:- start:26 stop:1417 length:1392 start_codon:yes stop_codon:yes gene_type:complete
MDFRFLSNRMKSSAFSSRPFSFLDTKERDAFALVMEILLLETGSRRSCETWQDNQLAALSGQARKRSKFWADRITKIPKNKKDLKNLPILTRKDLQQQVESEGSLIRPADRIGVKSGSSSGSSGTPVNFYVTAVNSKYSGVRGVAQDILEGRDFRKNRVKVSSATPKKTAGKKTFFESHLRQNWLGPLGNVFEQGHNKKIEYLNSRSKLLREIKVFAPKLLNCSPSNLDVIMGSGGVQTLKDLGIDRWIQFAGHRAPGLSEKFAAAGIEISANYSAEETGPMAFECTQCPDHFHVATSNVIIEVDDSITVYFDGHTLGRVLVTHLHGYATPFIRYDIGDFAQLHDTCPCGHDGPVMSKIYGRAKQFLHLPDGRYVSFYFDANDIQERAACKEFHIHQSSRQTVNITLGGRQDVTFAEVDALRTFIQYKAGYAFEVNVDAVGEIDWRDNPKQLGFTSAVAHDFD